MRRGTGRRCPYASRLAQRRSVARCDFRQWFGSGADSWLLLLQETRIRAVRASEDDTPCVRQIFPFSSIRTVTVGFGIAPNLLAPPVAPRALAGSGDCSPLPPVGTPT